jgi:hypothetical protein
MVSVEAYASIAGSSMSSLCFVSKARLLNIMGVDDDVLTGCQWLVLLPWSIWCTIDQKSMGDRRAAAAADDLESEAIALAFGATVHALRLQVGISLNELARRAGVDPAYIHRIEGRGPTSGAAGAQRPPLPRRPVVTAIAAALGSDARQTDQLLALAGHTPTALLELGGWDGTLASVAEMLADPAVSGPAKAEFREVVRILARRWARGGP